MVNLYWEILTKNLRIKRGYFFYYHVKYHVKFSKNHIQKNKIMCNNKKRMRDRPKFFQKKITFHFLKLKG